MQKGWPTRLFGLLLSLLALGMFCFAILLWLPLLAVTTALFFAGVFPWNWRRWRATPVLAVVLAVAMLVLSAKTNARQAATRLDAMAKKLHEGGPAALSDRNYAALYLISWGFPLGGWLGGYSEAAREHFFMLLPGKPERAFRNDFFMRAPGVREALTAFIRTLPVPPAGQSRLHMQEATLKFPNRGSFRRFALALNPLHLTATAEWNGSAWKLSVEGRVACRYPQHSQVMLMDAWGSPFHFEEGLFWALTERGWLHPYTAVWMTDVSATDPRFHP
jgi:hypothetical protein